MLGFSARRWARRAAALIFAAAAPALAFGPARAAADAPSPLAGRWRILAKTPRGARLIELAVKEDNGRLVGEVGSGANKTPVKQISASGGDYVVEYEMGRNGRGMGIRMTVSPRGDRFKGNAELPAQNIRFDVAGAREGTPQAAWLGLAAHALGANAKPGQARNGPAGRNGGPNRAAASEASPNSSPSSSPNSARDSETRLEPAAAERSIAMTEGRDFVGDWTLAIEAQTEAIRRVHLSVHDKAGMLAAIIEAPDPVGVVQIKTIERTSEGIKLGFGISLASQNFDLEMPLTFENGMLKGQMVDKGGLFELPLRGAPRGQEDRLDADSGAAKTGRAGAKKGEGFAEAEVAGRKISAQFGRPSTTDPAENQIPMAAAPGTIWPMGQEFATRLKTEAPIKTASGELPPGRYGLWARKTATGWELLINANPDVWVTQHKDAADLLALPMTARKLDQPAETMKLALKADGDAALLTVALGSDELSARIELKP